MDTLSAIQVFGVILLMAGWLSYIVNQIAISFSLKKAFIQSKTDKQDQHERAYFKRTEALKENFQNAWVCTLAALFAMQGQHLYDIMNRVYMMAF